MANIPVKFNEMMDLMAHYGDVMLLQNQIYNSILVGQGIGGIGDVDSNDQLYLWYNDLAGLYKINFASGNAADNAYNSISGALTSFSGIYQDIGFKTFMSSAFTTFNQLAANPPGTVDYGTNPFASINPQVGTLKSLYGTISSYVDQLERMIVSYEYAAKYNLFESQAALGVSKPQGIIGCLKQIFK